jgi:cell division protein FtsI/penicillin-binding protein 2
VAEAVRRLARAVGVDEEILADIVQRKKKDPLFRPIAMIEHATDTQVAAVMARRLELPEVVVQEEPTRAYPIDGFAAHLFGYVSEIQEAQLERVPSSTDCSPAPSSVRPASEGLQRASWAPTARRTSSSTASAAR